MTVRTKEYKVYTIDSHPNSDKCFDWIRDNWHNLGDDSVYDAIVSLEAFAKHIGAKLDYSISITPVRGEHISLSFDFYDDVKLSDLPDIDLNGNCPFTGSCYDEIILDAFRDDSNEGDLKDILNDIGYRMLKFVHDEGEYIYSDEGLQDMCESNMYEFKEDGSID